MALVLDSVKDFFFGKSEDNYDTDYENYDEGEYFDDEEFAEEESPRLSERNRGSRFDRGRRSFLRDSEPEDYGYEEPVKKTTPARIVLVRAKHFSEAKRIADNLKQDRSVVINFEEMDNKEAQRTLDFLSGTTFAKGGEIQKISHCTYIFTVGPVDLIGRIEEIKDTDSYFTF